MIGFSPCASPRKASRVEVSKRARIQEKGIGGMLDGENYFGGDGGGDDKPGESLGRYFQQNERAPSTTLILKPFQLQKNQ